MHIVNASFRMEIVKRFIMLQKVIMLYNVSVKTSIHTIENCKLPKVPLPDLNLGEADQKVFYDPQAQIKCT